MFVIFCFVVVAGGSSLPVASRRDFDSRSSVAPPLPQCARLLGLRTLCRYVPASLICSGLAGYVERSEYVFTLLPARSDYSLFIIHFRIELSSVFSVHFSVYEKPVGWRCARLLTRCSSALMRGVCKIA